MFARSFSESRQAPWKGWGKVLDQINILRKEHIKVLDLGSGNTRFYSYLKNNLKKDFEYLGVDQSNPLIKIAHEKYARNNNFSQQKVDVITDLDRINGLYDVVVAFGLTHHIPSSFLRKEWFKRVGSLVEKDGLLILTFWQIEKVQELNLTIIDKSKLDQGDMFLGWKKMKDAVRYVHLYSDLEINDVTTIINQNKITNIDRFYSDKSNKSSNLYLVFKKS